MDKILKFDEDKFTFTYLDTIKLIETNDGSYTYNYREQGKGMDETQLHAYWNEDFCEFKLSAPSKSGVYVFIVEGKVKYIGSGKNLKERFYWYQKINLSACKRGGQSTDCHINSEIYNAIKGGKEVMVYICETEDYKKIESRMRRLYKPEWNKQF